MDPTSHAKIILQKFIPSDMLAEFNSVLVESKAAVVGSSITQMITGDLYENSDLDICIDKGYYAPHNELKMITFIEKLGYAEEIRLSHYKNIYMDAKKNYNNTYIKKVMFFVNPRTCKKIDLIILERTDALFEDDYKITIASYILNYDLTCCMGYYDGKNLYHRYWSMTCDKIAIVLNSEKYDKDRILKYRLRNFEIFGKSPSIENIKNNVSKKMLLRLTNDIKLVVGRNVNLLKASDCEDNCYAITCKSIYNSIAKEMAEMKNIPITILTYKELQAENSKLNIELENLRKAIKKQKLVL